MHYVVTLTAWAIALTGSCVLIVICLAILKGSFDGFRDLIRKRKQRTIAVDYKATLRSIEELTRTMENSANSDHWAYPPCDKPRPPGYLPCTRELGHDGPCALHPERHCQVVGKVTGYAQKGCPPSSDPLFAFTITEQGWAHRSSAGTLRGYEHTDGKIYLEPKPPIPEREICKCRQCGKWGFVVDEFTSPYTGLCADCTRKIPDDVDQPPAPHHSST